MKIKGKNVLNVEFISLSGKKMVSIKFKYKKDTFWATIEKDQITFKSASISIERENEIINKNIVLDLEAQTLVGAMLVDAMFKQLKS